MFLEINDMSTGSLVVEPLNMLSVDSVYIKQADSKYQLFYKLNNGLIRIEEFDTQAEADNRLDEVKEMSIGGGGGSSANVYTYKGSCLFANKPSSGQVVGDVWNIEDNFTLDGKNYPAGTNIAWDGTGWDPLAGSMVAGGLTANGLVPSTAITSDSTVNLASLDTGIYYARGYTKYSVVNAPSSSQTISFSNYACKLTSYELTVVKKYSDAAVGDVVAYAYGDTFVTGALATQFVKLTKANNNPGLSIDVTSASINITSNIVDTATGQNINSIKTFLKRPRSSQLISHYQELPSWDQVIGILASPYDANATYAVNDYVYRIESNVAKTYKCITPCGPEAWTAAHWTQITPDIYNDFTDYVDSQVGNINTLLGGI